METTKDKAKTDSDATASSARQPDEIGDTTATGIAGTYGSAVDTAATESNGSNSAGAVISKVKSDAAEAKQAVKQQADEAAEKAKDTAKQHAAAGADRAASEADKISSAVEAAAQALEDEDREGMASYVRELGEGMSTFAERLQDRNAEQLTDDARSLARDNPTAFLLGSVAVGFGLSRFFKASAERSGSAAGSTTQYETGAQGADIRSATQSATPPTVNTSTLGESA